MDPVMIGRATNLNNSLRDISNMQSDQENRLSAKRKGRDDTRVNKRWKMEHFQAKNILHIK